MRRNKAESEQLRTKAYDLFMNASMTYSEIAEAVGVGKDTISEWAGRYQWKQTKAANSLTREKNVSRMLVQMSNLLDEIEKRDQRYPTPAESDIIGKMTKTIRELSGRTSLPDYFNVMNEFLKELHRIKPELAKELVSYSKEFLQAKAKDLDK